MVSVILIWMYMTVTAYLTGFGFLSLLPEIKKYTVKNEDSYIFAGIVVVTVYAQIFSLFGKVGWTANLLLVIFCVGITIGLKDQLKERLKNHFHGMRLSVSPVRMLISVLLLFLFAFGTSRGIIHYDTGLYHAQSIRWIEEYGIVPGLGNLHCRLAYNSSSFCLSALYGMKFLGGQSFHACAGFLAFLVAKVCLEGIRRGKVPKMVLPDLIRMTAVYYLINIFDEMISPASDYFMVLLFFYIIIRWLDLLEREEKSYIPFALLCLLGVFLMTVKLSAGLILLLVLKPAVMMIREKRKGAITGFLGLGLFTVLPYLIRNVILSGWLLYPSTFLNFFDPDWKIPQGAAEYDFREIQVWGRGYTDVAQYEKPLREWIGPWFARQNAVDKIFITAAAGTGVVLLMVLFYMLIRKKWQMTDWLLVSGTVSVCFFFWLASAPLIRYGCVYVWLAPVLTYGYLYMRGSPYLDKYINVLILRWMAQKTRLLSSMTGTKKRFYHQIRGAKKRAFYRKPGKQLSISYMVLYFILAIVGGYKIGAFGKELLYMLPRTSGDFSAENAYLLLQKDYENYPTISYELHGFTFYYAENGDRTGYDDFPASPARADDIFRGKTIRAGFRYAP